MEIAQERRTSFEEDHACPPDVEPGKVAGQHHREQFGEGARQLDAGRSSSDDRDVEGARLDQRGIDRSLLERLQHMASDADRVLQGLDGERMIRGAGNAEVVGDTAGGQDDEVV